MLAALLPGAPVHTVGGVRDLESGFPIEIEDAYPIGYLGGEAPVFVRYEHTHDGVGIGDESPDVRPTLGVHYEF